MNNQKKVKYLKKAWTVKSLAPIQFVEESFWPFAYYVLSDDGWTKKKKEIKRDWKLKPKDVIDDEARIENAIKHALKYGAGVNGDLDETLRVLLLAEIYSLTYQLSNIEKYFTPQMTLSRDFVEGLAVKAKALNVEPYSFLADLSKEKPELYNPKRYDFNFFVLGVGWEKERREMEKAQADIKRKTGKR